MKKLYRLPQVQDIVGLSRSSLYAHMAQGLFPKPVQIGVRAVAWPSQEVEAILDARTSGKNETQIKALVVELLNQRTEVA